MKILVLGSTGYLGGNIVSQLLKDGHFVICVVRPTSDYSRLDINNNNLELISNNLEQIELTLKTQRIDWIINAICTYNPNESLYGDMLNSNVMFPLSVLNLAIKYNVSRFMTMDSGLPNKFNVYSFTKYIFSEFGNYLSLKDNITFLNLQLEMFYGGDNEPESRFMKSCLSKLKENKTLQLTAGKQKRDIIRVEDVVNIISLLINNQTINGYYDLPVGSGESKSIIEIIEFMKDKTGSDSTLDFGAVSIREGEPDTCADISWLRKINYDYNFSFFEGLEEYCLRH